MPKRTPEEILRAIEKPSSEEETDRLLAMNEEELDAELAKAGFTPEQLVALEEKLLGPAPAAPAETKSPAKEPKAPRERLAKVIFLRPRATLLWGRVAAAAAVLGPVGYLALSEVGQEAVYLVAAGQDGGPELYEAKALREKAGFALQAGEASRCLALLDEAKKLDPEGDKAEAVMWTRRTAMEKLGTRDGGAGP
jgi:hypothetical protein